MNALKTENLLIKQGLNCRGGVLLKEILEWADRKTKT